MGSLLANLTRPYPLGENVAQFALSLDATPSLEEVAGLGIAMPDSLANAVPKRKIEWMLGRYCARRACQELGVKDAKPLLSGPDRSPLWAPGLVGSITHTEGWVAAAVGRSENVGGLGIDTEVTMSPQILAEVRSQIFSRAEDELASAYRSTMETSQFFTVIFSAKESLFKCLYPSVKRFFSYEDADIIGLDLPAGRFHVNLLTDLSGEFTRGMSLTGSFTTIDRFVHTAMAIPPK